MKKTIRPAAVAAFGGMPVQLVSSIDVEHYGRLTSVRVLGKDGGHIYFNLWPEDVKALRDMLTAVARKR